MAFDEVARTGYACATQWTTRSPAQWLPNAGFALEGTMGSALLHKDGWHDQHLHARIVGDE